MPATGSEIVTDFVLIHGAYQGGWIWKFVSERLRAKGHNVLAPSLDGCAERAEGLRAGITTETHGAEIANLLYFQDLKNVVLVGTSSGGMVMACAAEKARERVARLVFADALALFDGETILDIVKRPTTAIVTPLARGPSREDAVGRLFAGLAPPLRDPGQKRTPIWTPQPMRVLLRILVFSFPSPPRLKFTALAVLPTHQPLQILRKARNVTMTLRRLDVEMSERRGFRGQVMLGT
jgi:pimeloyl-ACP methyl ester carboxylesterase